MQKESKTAYYHFRLTPTQKERLYSRATELHQEPSAYLLSLLEKDTAGYDMTETEKPRMQEFAQRIGSELVSKLLDHFDQFSLKTKSREDKIFALLLLNYRQTFFQFQSIKNRHEAMSKLSAEEIKICDEKSRKTLNELFKEYLEFVTTNDTEKILSYLKQSV